MTANRQALSWSADLFWARNGIVHGLAAVGMARSMTVLVPSFICKCVPQAVQAFGSAIEFYRVDHDCRIDLNDVMRRIHSGVGAVLAVHYFGTEQQCMAQLRSLCDQRGLWLIEDCAHMLPEPDTASTIGSIGHIRLFSWRKFLPIYDGASVRVEKVLAEAHPRKLMRRWALELRAAKHVATHNREAPVVGPQSASADLITNREFRHESELRPVPFNPNSDQFSSKLVDIRMTRASALIRNCSKLKMIVSVRRRHWQTLRDGTREVPTIQPLRETLPSGVAPWCFAFRIRNAPEAHKKLRAMGVAAATWSDVMPDELSGALREEAATLYQDLIFVPVHQHLAESDLQFVLAAILRVARPGMGSPAS